MAPLHSGFHSLLFSRTSQTWELKTTELCSLPALEALRLGLRCGQGWSHSEESLGPLPDPGANVFIDIGSQVEDESSYAVSLSHSKDPPDAPE